MRRHRHYQVNLHGAERYASDSAYIVIGTNIPPVLTKPTLYQRV